MLQIDFHITSIPHCFTNASQAFPPSLPFHHTQRYLQPAFTHWAVCQEPGQPVVCREELCEAHLVPWLTWWRGRTPRRCALSCTTPGGTCARTSPRNPPAASWSRRSAGRSYPATPPEPRGQGGFLAPTASAAAAGWKCSELCCCCSAAEELGIDQSWFGVN